MRKIFHVINIIGIINIFLCIVSLSLNNAVFANTTLYLNFVFTVYLIFEIVKMRTVITERFQAGLVVVLGVSFIFVLLLMLSILSYIFYF